MNSINMADVVAAVERTRRSFQRMPSMVGGITFEQAMEAATLSALEAAGDSIEGRLGFVLYQHSRFEPGEGVPLPETDEYSRVFRELRLSAMVRWIVREMGRQAMGGMVEEESKRAPTPAVRKFSPSEAPPPEPAEPDPGSGLAAFAPEMLRQLEEERIWHTVYGEKIRHTAPKWDVDHNNWRLDHISNLLGRIEQATKRGAK